VVRSARVNAATERARWLGEVAEAIGLAEELVETLELAHRHNSAWTDLAADLAAAHAEVSRLRLGNSQFANCSEWTEQIPWKYAV